MYIKKAIQKYLDTKKFASSTKDTYSKYLEEFLIWHTNFDIKEVTQSDVDIFFERVGLKTNKESTLNGYSYALKSFFNFYGLNFIFPTWNKPEPKGKFISSEEYDKCIDRVYDSYRTSELEINESILLRDILIIQLFIETGITVTELSHLKINNFRPKQRALVVREINRPDRIVPISQSTVKMMQSYIVKFCTRRKILFVRYDRASHEVDTYITARSIQRCVNRYTDGKFTPKDFRFTFIVASLLKGRGIYEISDCVGGISDDTKTYLRKFVNLLKTTVILNDNDYNAFEYLRHKYGKDNLFNMILQEAIETIFIKEMKRKARLLK